jgi:hypothetical protein
MVSNKIQKCRNKILTSPILPNFAHRCAVLNLPSYDTLKGFSFEFKRDFKRFKWVRGLSLDSTECLSNNTMRKLNKIKLFVFDNSAVFTRVNRGFKKYIKTMFFHKNSTIHLFILKLQRILFAQAIDGYFQPALPQLSVAINYLER